MRIALDHDGTYDLDPDLWNGFVNDALNAGHEVFCVTMRGPTARITIPSVETIYTSGRAKIEYCKEIGIRMDIWIDDQPWKVYENARSL